MSNDALTWAFNQDNIKPGPKFVLISLADYADEAGSCFPSVPKIARRTGYGESTVRVHIDALIEMRLIREERRHRSDGSRTSNRYYLRLAPDSGGGPTGE